MATGWRTVAIFGMPKEALEAEQKLQKAQIPCRLLTDSATTATVAYHGSLAAPAGGTKLQVDETDLAEAAIIVGDYSNAERRSRPRVEALEARTVS